MVARKKGIKTMTVLFKGAEHAQGSVIYHIQTSGAPNENIVHNHLNIALLNVV